MLTLEKWFVYFMTQYEVLYRTGRVLVGEAHFQTIKNPPTNRLLDVAWISLARLPLSLSGILYTAPEWIIEIKSPDDSKANIDEKEAEYFAAGVIVVSLVDPRNKTFRSRWPGKEETLSLGDTLTLPDILPGFKLDVASIFAQ